MTKRVLCWLVVVLVVGILAGGTTLYVTGMRASTGAAQMPHGVQAGAPDAARPGARPAAARASAGAASASSDEDARRIEHGRYLARIGNCMGCHTASSGAPYAGGTPLDTPFGTFFGPNITPHEQHGIGRWTANDFWQALHEGRSPQGGFYYPAFPYTAYTRVTREDADALFAFLQTVPPDPTPSTPHALAFPYSMRSLLPLWRGLYFRPGADTAVVPQDAQPAAWLRGHYLVEGLGHCAACHTARDRLGASRDTDHLGGGMVDTLNWWAPALTAQKQGGLGLWSERDIADLLRTGVSARGTAAGPMGEVVRESLQHLTDGDAQAMAHYLTHLPQRETVSEPAALSDADAGTLQLGAQRYAQHCSQCHQADGQGMPPHWPALVGNSSVTAPSPHNVIRMILHGGFAPATVANPQPHGMPPFGQILNDQDIAALSTYIRQSWGNAAGAVNGLAVKRARERQ